MELSSLKKGDYIKKINGETYFYLREISVCIRESGHEDKYYLFEKLIEEHEDGLQCWVIEGSRDFDNYIKVDKIPEKYIPF